MYSHFTRSKLSTYVTCILCILLAYTITGISAQAAPGRVHRGNSLVPAIDQVSQQVLLNMHVNGWNPNAQFRGVTTGGVFVNWNMFNPGQTNLLGIGDQNPAGCNILPLPANCPNPQTIQDPQTALYYLNALTEYITLHPQDHRYDSDRTRMVNLVIYEYANYNLPKGWIYFYLLRDGLLLQNSTLINEAYHVAYNYYTSWYNPQLGFVYNRAPNPGVSTTEHSITAGAALINAGLRWHVPAWVQAGQSTIDHILATAYNPSYNLFYTSMLVYANGAQQVLDSQAKSEVQGCVAEALMDAYVQTANPHYLSIVNKLLYGTFVTSGLWDQANGGFFFAIDMSNGKLKNQYKETRAQAHTLIALVRYNGIAQLLHLAPQFQDKMLQLRDLLANRFYQTANHGYFYRLTPIFNLYTTSAGLLESYFTTEAMGLAVDALQQTEFTNLAF